MPQRFTWERGPFELCPQCMQRTFGILSAGGHGLTLRCTECRFSYVDGLPVVDKRVLYLDQNAFSVLFAVSSGGRLPKGHEDFAQEMHRRLRRVVLLQQAILPHSDIHRDETTVFRDASALRRAYEMIGGDISFTDTHSVEQHQIAEYASAYMAQREPALNFDVDEVLEDERNDWLRDMHITVDMHYEQFADQLRASRDRGHEAMMRLVERWAAERPTFDAVLQHEMNAFAAVRKSGLVAAVDAVIATAGSHDPMAYFNASQNAFLLEQLTLRHAFLEAGYNERDAGREVIRFWEWERNKDIPHHRISSYLFAGMARRVVGGQRRVTRGFVNDVRAISTYAPYVDAMFIDRECADLLREGRLRDDLQYKAQIFSFADTQAFLAYLQEIEDQASTDVRALASRIYGLDR